MSPSAILAIIRAAHYDLGNEKLEILNEIVRLKDFLRVPEFINDPFVWQMTAGTRFSVMNTSILTVLVNLFNLLRVKRLYLKQLVRIFSVVFS